MVIEFDNLDKDLKRHTSNGVDSERVSGRDLLNAPQATIGQPSGGATIDVEARAAINSLITMMKNLGLMKK